MTCVSQQTVTATIEFEAPLHAAGATTLVRLPDDASRALPSRGQVAVEGSIDGRHCETVLEPDGMRGHWLRVGPDLTDRGDGEVVHVALRVRKDWPEPDVPADLAAALSGAPQTVRDVWDDITPMARWEWVRWVNATANPDTRRRRVEVTISKIDHGKRRPCCFDLSACTDPAVAKSGKLRL
jgi:hypothetical protein